MRRKSSRAFLVAASVLAFLLGISYIAGHKAWQAVEKGRDAIFEAEFLMREERDFSGASDALRRASDNFTAASRNALVFSYLQIVPGLSGNIRASRVGLKSAGIASAAFGDVAGQLARVYAPMAEQSRVEMGVLPVEKRMEVLRSIDAAVPVLKGVSADLEHARVMLENISRFGLVDKLKTALDELDSKISLADALLSESIPLLEIIPGLVGFPNPSLYLFVLQNSDELRPAGGFIGTYGIIEFNAGHISGFFTDDIYNIDRFSPPAARPAAPEPLARYLGQPYWYLRDANWDPDFPVSAQRILEFYRQEAAYVPAEILPIVNYAPQDKPDGVIAIMPAAMRSLLEITGPVTVGSQIFTAENLVDMLEFEVEIKFEERGIPRPQRKSIISELGHALIAEIMALPVSRWPEVLHSIRAASDEKQILLYAVDADLQQRIAEHHWGGAMEKAPGDYLAVIDANLFSLKTDPYINRKISYNVSRGPLGLAGEVTISYAYPISGPAWKTKGYRTWTRVYVPEGSILSYARGAMSEEESELAGAVTISQEYGKTVFGAFVAVQVGEEKQLTFSYRLPEEVNAQAEQGAYELFVQKQAGTDGHPLTVLANFDKLPGVWAPTGLRAARTGAEIRWNTALRRDQKFHVAF